MFVLRKKHLAAALFALVLAVFSAMWLRGSGTQPAVPVSAPLPTASPRLAEETAAEPTYPAAETLSEDTKLGKETPIVGVWIPYMSLMTPECTEESFCENFEEMLDTAERFSVNAVFVHVRPFADSLYPSDYEPWSHILTGVQGQDPGFDPLAYMVDATHRRKIQFHAWINPLRISTGKTPAILSEDSFYLRNREDHPAYFIEFDSGVYYNPASAEIRERIAESAAEIAEKYEVDGIHFDDYFYPTDDEGIDSDQYAAYVESTVEPLPLHEWRTANINALITTVYHQIKQANESVAFGISPQGNLRNNEKINADVFTWCTQSGYIDYICPQLYYSLENPALPFGTALEEWNAIPRLDSVKLLIGLAVYKAGTDADEGTWLDSEDILMQQIGSAEDCGADGILFYAIDHLRFGEAEAELANAQAAAEAFLDGSSDAPEQT